MNQGLAGFGGLLLFACCAIFLLLVFAGGFVGMYFLLFAEKYKNIKINKKMINDEQRYG